MRLCLMGATDNWVPQWVSDHPWSWGVMFGAIVGGGVLILSTLKYGFRLSNLILGVVVFIAFGLLGFVGGLARRFAPGGPV
jgi:hypothetical protein